MDAPVAPRQRWTRQRRCPICGGCDLDPRGQGIRCGGYMGTDGKYAHCSREEHAGGLPIEALGTYAHRLEGPCKCGTTHGEAPVSWPSSSAPPAAPRDTKPPNVIQGGNGHANGNGANGHSRRSELHGEVDTGSWDYETGLRVVRKDGFYDDGQPGKRYLQFHRHEDGRFAPGLAPRDNCPPGCKGAARTLYRAPELRAAGADAFIFFVEGEKCVERLRGAGLEATCSPGGADGWPKLRETGVHLELLRRRHVVIIPDHDPVHKKTGKRPGIEFATMVRDDILPVARSLRWLELPGLAEGEDVYDWLERGLGDAEDLVKLAEARPDLAQRFPLIQPAAVELWARPLPPALPTGIRGLDNAIGGLRAESLTILNGPPGRGKSGLALQIARHIGAIGHPVVVITLELSERQTIARVAAQVMRRSWLEIFEWGPSEAPVVAAAVADLSIRVVRPARTQTIRSVLDRAADEAGEAPVVVVDYLQYAATWMGTDDLRLAVGKLSQDLGGWVTDTRSSGLVVSSVARDKYHLEDDVVAEDLQGAGKESGQIDFDAAAELFLYAQHPPPGGTAQAKLYVTKGRFGGAGTVVGLTFNGAIGSFVDDPTVKLTDIELQCLRAVERGAASAAEILDKEGPHQVKARKDAVLKALRSLVRLALIDGPPYRSTPPRSTA